MTTPKRIDRKAFLASTVAAVSAVTLGSCAGESVEDATGGTSTGGTATGGTATGGTATGGTATGGTATGGTATGGTATGGTATGGTATGGGAGLAAGAPGGGASGNGGLGGAPTGGSSGAGGAGGAGGMSASGGTGGDGGSGGGGTYVCTTQTSNGDHSHPLVVPSIDVQRGYQDAPYVLEDGGTGHTHTVEVTIYDFGYLKGGTVVTNTSTSTANHTHECVISCVI